MSAPSDSDLRSEINRMIDLDSRLSFEVITPKELANLINVKEILSVKNPIYLFTVDDDFGEKFSCVAFTNIVDSTKRVATRADGLGKALAVEGGKLFKFNPLLIVYDYVGSSIMAVPAIRLFDPFYRAASSRILTRPGYGYFSMTPHFQNGTINMYGEVESASIAKFKIEEGSVLYAKKFIKFLEFVRDATKNSNGNMENLVQAIVNRIGSPTPSISEDDLLITENSILSTEDPGSFENHDTSIVQEQIEGRESGVEFENPDSPGEMARPWDPGLIRVDPKTFSLRHIVDMIDDGDLDLSPEFQRHRVWNSLQKSRLIESILLRIPLPAFYFSSDKEGRMQVVDGLQRLSTVHSFTKDMFALDQLEYLQEQLKGKHFSEIKDTLWGRRIHTTQIVVNVIDPQTPTKVKFDIFKRINTLGEPLVPQEIRHCMSRKPSREFLYECANAPWFIKATTGSFKDHKRMADREAVLRFCAFWMLDEISEYDLSESMDVFLTSATERLDSMSVPESRKDIAFALENACECAFALFGPYAFRKWKLEEERINPINKALFECWTVGLANYKWEELAPRKDAIVSAARKAMTDDWVFIDSISTSTGDSRKVKLRFRFVKAIIENAGKNDFIVDSSAFID